MKLLKITSQHRRDCKIIIECEGCHSIEENISAYDDNYYWSCVLPERKCEVCNESTNSLGLKKEKVVTKYLDYQTV